MFESSSVVPDMPNTCRSVFILCSNDLCDTWTGTLNKNIVSFQLTCQKHFPSSDPGFNIHITLWQLPVVHGTLLFRYNATLKPCNVGDSFFCNVSFRRSAAALGVIDPAKNGSQIEFLLVHSPCLKLPYPPNPHITNLMLPSPVPSPPWFRASFSVMKHQEFSLGSCCNASEFWLIRPVLFIILPYLSHHYPPNPHILVFFSSITISNSLYFSSRKIHFSTQFSTRKLH